MKILIPTYRSLEEITSLIDEVQYYSPEHSVYATCEPVSAAKNRNICLNYLSLGEIAIMIDDDISGFYPGWIDDLTEPLLSNTDVVMVSARLLKQDGKTFGPTCSGCMKTEPEVIEVSRNRLCTLPTAAIAFKFQGHIFDENFRGSGWEDNDWCLKYRQSYAGAKFIQSNRCKLIHLNEMKEQKGENWNWNRNYFNSRWPRLPENIK